MYSGFSKQATAKLLGIQGIITILTSLQTAGSIPLVGLAVSRLGNELRDYDFVKKPKRTKIHVHRIKVTVSPFSVIPTLANFAQN